MPEVNLSQIQARYDEQLARLYSTVDYDADDVSAYALIRQNINDVGIIVVSTIDDLPDLLFSDFPNGMIYFIQGNGILVINSNNKWLTLDGILLRNDNV